MFTNNLETRSWIHLKFLIDFLWGSATKKSRQMWSSWKICVHKSQTMSIETGILTGCSNSDRPNRRNWTPAARFHVEIHSLRSWKRQKKRIAAAAEKGKEKKKKSHLIDIIEMQINKLEMPHFFAYCLLLTENALFAYYECISSCCLSIYVFNSCTNTQEIRFAMI